MNEPCFLALATVYLLFHGMGLMGLNLVFFCFISSWCVCVRADFRRYWGGRRYVGWLDGRCGVWGSRACRICVYVGECVGWLREMVVVGPAGIVIAKWRAKTVFSREMVENGSC